MQQRLGQTRGPAPELGSVGRSSLQEPVRSTLYCECPTRAGKCSSLLGSMAGNWYKVRQLMKDEPAQDGSHVLACNNKRCRALWEVRQITTSAA